MGYITMRLKPAALLGRQDVTILGPRTGLQEKTPEPGSIMPSAVTKLIKATGRLCRPGAPHKTQNRMTQSLEKQAHARLA